jgi:hypothetical protein
MLGGSDQANRASDKEKAGIMKKKSCIQHQENVPAHNALAVK